MSEDTIKDKATQRIRLRESNERTQSALNKTLELFVECGLTAREVKTVLCDLYYFVDLQLTSNPKFFNPLKHIDN